MTQVILVTSMSSSSELDGLKKDIVSLTPS